MANSQDFILNVNNLIANLRPLKLSEYQDPRVCLPALVALCRAESDQYAISTLHRICAYNHFAFSGSSGVAIPIPIQRCADLIGNFRFQICYNVGTPATPSYIVREGNPIAKISLMVGDYLSDVVCYSLDEIFLQTRHRKMVAKYPIDLTENGDTLIINGLAQTFDTHPSDYTETSVAKYGIILRPSRENADDQYYQCNWDFPTELHYTCRNIKCHVRDIGDQSLQPIERLAVTCNDIQLDLFRPDRDYYFDRSKSYNFEFMSSKPIKTNTQYIEVSFDYLNHPPKNPYILDPLNDLVVHPPKGDFVTENHSFRVASTKYRMRNQFQPTCISKSSRMTRLIELFNTSEWQTIAELQEKVKTLHGDNQLILQWIEAFAEFSPLIEKIDPDYLTCKWHKFY
jgi:hypothetical protein